MKERLVILLAAAAALFMLAACAHDGALGTRPAGDTRQFTDPAVPVLVSTGERFVIIPESNATTGYSWREVGRGPSIISLTSKEYSSPKDSGVVGKPGIERWEFTALSPGTGELVFEYVRPWEKDVQPVRTVSFTVKVEEGR